MRSTRWESRVRHEPALIGSIVSLAVLSVTTGALPLAVAIVVGTACLGALWGPGMFLLSNAARKADVDEGYAFVADVLAGVQFKDGQRVTDDDTTC